MCPNCPKVVIRKSADKLFTTGWWRWGEMSPFSSAAAGQVPGADKILVF